MTDNRVEVHQQRAKPWNVTLVDAGAVIGGLGRFERSGAGIVDD
ncbi:hypothetical protein [Bradyrhizobium japonicum]